MPRSADRLLSQGAWLFPECGFVAPSQPIGSPLMALGQRSDPTHRPQTISSHGLNSTVVGRRWPAEALRPRTARPAPTAGRCASSGRSSMGCRFGRTRCSTWPLAGWQRAAGHSEGTFSPAPARAGLAVCTGDWSQCRLCVAWRRHRGNEDVGGTTSHVRPARPLRRPRRNGRSGSALLTQRPHRSGLAGATAAPDPPCWRNGRRGPALLTQRPQRSGLAREAAAKQPSGRDGQPAPGPHANAADTTWSVRSLRRAPRARLADSANSRQCVDARKSVPA